MGQNDAARPQDVSESSGPLWCVPVTASTGAIWGPFPADHTLVSIEAPAGLLTPNERHRIFSSQFSTIFYTCPIRSLQDGRRVCVVLRDPSGAEIRQTLDFKLAFWQVPGVPQIVSFIVSRVLPKIEGLSDHSTLERFLSFISSWKASCRLSAAIGGRNLYTLDAAPGLLAREQGSIFVAQQSLYPAMLSCLSSRGATVLVAPKGLSERAYTDIDGELVELDFSAPSTTEQESAAWIQNLDAPAKNALLDSLSADVSEGQSISPLCASALLKTATVSLAEPGARLTVEGAFSTSDQLFLFAEMIGTAPLETARIELFGSAAGQGLAPHILSTARHEQGGLSKTRLVMKVDLRNQPQPLACKMSAAIGGQPVEHWVQVQAAHAGGFAFARSFWPHAESDDRYITDIAAPLAQAWASQPVEVLTRLAARARSRGTQSAIDLQIISEPYIESLHHTLLGVRSSVPLDQPIRVTLPFSHDADAAGREVSDLTRRYGFDAQIDLMPPHAPAAVALRTGLLQAAETLVSLRAGFIPPHNGWLAEVTETLRQSPEAILVGLSSDMPRREPKLSELSVEDLLDCLMEDTIVSIAVPTDLLSRIQLEAPACHSLVGAWAEMLIEALGRGARVFNHPGLDLLKTDPARAHDTFCARIDEINLARKLAAVKHPGPLLSREAVVSA